MLLEPVARRQAAGYRPRATAFGEMPAGEVFQIPITEVADLTVVEGPSVIKSENGMLRSYVQLNLRDRDIVGSACTMRNSERGMRNNQSIWPRVAHLLWRWGSDSLIYQSSFSCAFRAVPRITPPGPKDLDHPPVSACAQATS